MFVRCAFVARVRSLRLFIKMEKYFSCFVRVSFVFRSCFVRSSVPSCIALKAYSNEKKMPS